MPSYTHSGPRVARPETLSRTGQAQKENKIKNGTCIFYFFICLSKKDDLDQTKSKTVNNSGNKSFLDIISSMYVRSGLAHPR